MAKYVNTSIHFPDAAELRRFKRVAKRRNQSLGELLREGARQIADREERAVRKKSTAAKAA